VIRTALHASVIFAAEAVWIILAHSLDIAGAAKYGGMLAVAWVAAAIGEGAISDDV
jgi:hypothetical protein